MKKKLLFLMAVLAAAAVCCKTPVPEPKPDDETPTEKPDPEPEPEPEPQPAVWHFSGGQGTEAEPFLIATARDLDSLSFYTNSAQAAQFVSAYYKQTANIDLAGKALKPIAEAGEFKGV